MSASVPSTFLELVSRTHDECGFTTDRAPTSVLNQNNMAKKTVNWVRDAHKLVQLEQTNWTFDWAQTGGALVANQEAYDPLVDWGDSVKEFVKTPQAAYVYKTATGTVTRQFLTYLTWEQFRGLNIPPLPSEVPIYWTQRPDGDIVYFPSPSNALWTTVHECYLNPLVLVADTDEPRMPTEYRMSIVWRAVLLFCGNQKDGDLYQHATQEYGLLMDAMREKNLPQWLSGGSLA